jgi:hypothetical protein
MATIPTCSSAAATSFAHGRIGVAQLLASKPGIGTADVVPLTRRDLYVDAQPELREA